MKDKYTYELSVNVDMKEGISSITWEETFSRDDVKNFFSPGENLYNVLLYLPELFTPDEAASLTPEEIASSERKAQEILDNFQFDVILNDCLDIWLQDLTRDFHTEISELNSEAASKYNARLAAIDSMDKIEAVRSLFALLEDMRNC